MIKINSIEDVGLYSIEKKFINKLKINYRENVISNVQGVISSTISTGCNLLLTWTGSSLVMSGVISLGTFFAFSSLSGFFMEPIGRLVSIQMDIQEADIALKRINELFDVEEENQSDNSKEILSDYDGELKFDNVSFRYPNRELLFSKISLSIKKGEKVAIVGNSGCGKTTLGNMILGIWSPENGIISLNNVNIADLDLTNLRRRIAYVQQNVELFSGTIVDNIKILKENATINEIHHVCELSKCDDFINKLPQRYNTYLEEAGSNLSGGEKQRLAIARALIKEPDVLILDEATSNLDLKTESEVLGNLFKCDITEIFIAHRLQSITKCDRIFFIDDGHITESETHEELINLKGNYYSMWMSQIQ